MQITTKTKNKDPITKALNKDTTLPTHRRFRPPARISATARDPVGRRVATKKGLAPVMCSG